MQVEVFAVVEPQQHAGQGGLPSDLLEEQERTTRFNIPAG